MTESFKQGAINDRRAALVSACLFWQTDMSVLPPEASQRAIHTVLRTADVFLQWLKDGSTPEYGTVTSGLVRIEAEQQVGLGGGQAT
jgi:hypothetical protein